MNSTNNCWKLNRVLRFSLLAISPFIFHMAQAFDQISVKSRWGQYDIEKKNGDYFIGNEKINSPHLAPLLQVAQTSSQANCPKKFKAEIEIHLKDGSSSSKRSVSLNEGLIKSESGCTLISGSGLDVFPLDKSWLIGLDQQKTPVIDDIKYKSSALQFSAKKLKGEWELRSSSDDQFNYELLESFVKSLESYQIQSYIHFKAAQKKPMIQVKTNSKVWKFYQLSPTTWALKVPNKPWLQISSQWANWKDLDRQQWTDSYAKDIQLILSPSATTEEKSLRIEKMGTTWSEALKRAYQKCLLNTDNEASLRVLCLQRMRQRPTQSNTETVIKLIRSTEEDSLINEAYHYLKIQNPKGLRPSPKVSRSQFLNYWVQWWKTKKD
ncbi:hypothetical protein GW916_01875 [bacterium]|nr:hypothetical protein [bacterium]